MRPMQSLGDLVKFIGEKHPSRLIITRGFFNSLRFQVHERAYHPAPDEHLIIEGVRVEAPDKKEVDQRGGGEWDLTGEEPLEIKSRIKKRRENHDHI